MADNPLEAMAAAASDRSKRDRGLGPKASTCATCGTKLPSHMSTCQVCWFANAQAAMKLGRMAEKIQKQASQSSDDSDAATRENMQAKESRTSSPRRGKRKAREKEED